jgi:hypothetical protein
VLLHRLSDPSRTSFAYTITATQLLADPSRFFGTTLAESVSGDLAESITANGIAESVTIGDGEGKDRPSQPSSSEKGGESKRSLPGKGRGRGLTRMGEGLLDLASPTSSVIIGQVEVLPPEMLNRLYQLLETGRWCEGIYIYIFCVSFTYL